MNCACANENQPENEKFISPDEQDANMVSGNENQPENENFISPDERDADMVSGNENQPQRGKSILRKRQESNIASCEESIVDGPKFQKSMKLQLEVPESEMIFEAIPSQADIVEKSGMKKMEKMVFHGEKIVDSPISPPFSCSPKFTPSLEDTPESDQEVGILFDFRKKNDKQEQSLRNQTEKSDNSPDPDTNLENKYYPSDNENENQVKEEIQNGDETEKDQSEKGEKCKIYHTDNSIITALSIHVFDSLNPFNNSFDGMMLYNLMFPYDECKVSSDGSFNKIDNDSKQQEIDLDQKIREIKNSIKLDDPKSQIEFISFSMSSLQKYLSILLQEDIVNSIDRLSEYLVDQIEFQQFFLEEKSRIQIFDFQAEKLRELVWRNNSEEIQYSEDLHVTIENLIKKIHLLSYKREMIAQELDAVYFYIQKLTDWCLFKFVKRASFSRVLINYMMSFLFSYNQFNSSEIDFTKQNLLIKATEIHKFCKNQANQKKNEITDYLNLLADRMFYKIYDLLEVIKKDENEHQIAAMTVASSKISEFCAVYDDLIYTWTNLQDKILDYASIFSDFQSHTLHLQKIDGIKTNIENIEKLN